MIGLAYGYKVKSLAAEANEALFERVLHVTLYPEGFFLMRSSRDTGVPVMGS